MKLKILANHDNLRRILNKQNMLVNILNTKLFCLQDGTYRREGGKRGRKPGRKAADKVDMKAKLGRFSQLTQKMD